ncbi:hypothetical protein LJK88_24810 [Paenibacillus sp. P26]|nr:hypothetical protein LJK88_24810 [Paenibacillus sp. P26]
MMKPLRAFMSRLPIRWKIMLWSTIILCLLFAAYNAAQFFAIGVWLNNQEQISMQKSMAQLEDYYQERNADTEQVKQSRSYLEKILEKKRLIRVLDQNGLPVVAVSDRLPGDWVPPQGSLQSLLVNVWHEDEHLLVMRSPINTGHFSGTIELINNLETLDQISDLLLFVMIIAGIGAVFFKRIGRTASVKTAASTDTIAFGDDPEHQAEGSS